MYTLPHQASAVPLLAKYRLSAAATGKLTALKPFQANQFATLEMNFSKNGMQGSPHESQNTPKHLDSYPQICPSNLVSPIRGRRSVSFKSLHGSPGKSPSLQLAL